MSNADNVEELGVTVDNASIVQMADGFNHLLRLGTDRVQVGALTAEDGDVLLLSTLSVAGGGFVDSSLSVVSGRLVGESLSIRSAAVVQGSALSVKGFSFVGSGDVGIEIAIVDVPLYDTMKRLLYLLANFLTSKFPA